MRASVRGATDIATGHERQQSSQSLQSHVAQHPPTRRADERQAPLPVGWVPPRAESQVIGGDGRLRIIQARRKSLGRLRNGCALCCRGRSVRQCAGGCALLAALLSCAGSTQFFSSGLALDRWICLNLLFCSLQASGLGRSGPSLAAFFVDGLRSRCAVCLCTGTNIACFSRTDLGAFTLPTC